MTRCITLASILAFAACTHRPPPPPDPVRAAPAPLVAPAVEQTSITPTRTESAITTSPKPVPTIAPEPECRPTRAGTCWGQPKFPRVTKSSPGAKP